MMTTLFLSFFKIALQKKIFENLKIITQRGIDLFFIISIWLFKKNLIKTKLINSFNRKRHFFFINKTAII